MKLRIVIELHEDCGSKKNEERLLEQSSKDIETRLRSCGESRKDVREIHSEGVQNFFERRVDGGRASRKLSTSED